MIGFLKFLWGLFYLLGFYSCGYPPQDFLVGIISMVLGTVALLIAFGMENKQEAKESSEVEETLDKF
tara:strand:- start:343 stop:543 length:201 start_codon:yes stop_codon:yes gene_type:complete